MMQRKWILRETDEFSVRDLQAVLDMHPLISRLLVQRGIYTLEQAQAFFKPSLRDLHDPFLMKDMEKAVERMHRAIDEGEKILLYGDYDVDGTTSVALMYTFLERRYNQLGYYLPDRYKEGYGLSFTGVDYAREHGYSLIIAMDCGIKAVEQVEYAAGFGIDVIICDHHLPGDQLPPATAILDPLQKDCNYPFKDLSGCGIVFKLVQAFEQENNIPVEELNSLLDYVVISIASDIVPLVGENRILARHGLKQLNYTHRPGLLALIEQSNLRRPLRIRDIVFGLAPVINAAGRLANAEQAVRLMLARTRKAARKYADELEICNNARRVYDQSAALEAEQLLQEEPELTNRKSIVLFQPHWHKGVIGIVASRLAEKYHKPTIILTQSDNSIVGSARSVSEFDIHDILESCRDMLINYGGHKYAAGMTLAPDNVERFQNTFEERVAIAILPDQEEPGLDIAAELPLSEIGNGIWKFLSQFAPFGPGNHQPVFISRNVRDAGYSKQLNGKHLRLALKQDRSKVYYGVAYGQADLLEKVTSSETFDICYTFQKNSSDRRHSFQLVIRDIRFNNA